MKNFLLIILLSSLWYINANCQTLSPIGLSFASPGPATPTPAQNLQKYWQYRKLLENSFVWVSPNNEKGSNLPAERYLNGSIYWDDGNNTLPTYLGVLATEYKLLKDNGQDVTRTRNQLYYALLAFERLDYWAETYSWASPRTRLGGCSYTPVAPSLNGFFMRDDVEASTIKNAPCFAPYYNSTTNTTSFSANYYTNGINNGGGGAIMSKDVVIHALLGLSLISYCVNDPATFTDILGNKRTIMQMVQDICINILNTCENASNNKSPWTICYPNSNCQVVSPQGGDFLFENTHIIGYCDWAYGVCSAANWILSNQGGSGLPSSYMNSVNAENKSLNGSSNAGGTFISMAYDQEVWEDGFKATQNPGMFMACYAISGENDSYLTSIWKSCGDQVINEFLNGAPYTNFYNYDYYLILDEALHHSGVTKTCCDINTSWAWLQAAPDYEFKLSYTPTGFSPFWCSANLLTQPYNNGFTGNCGPNECLYDGNCNGQTSAFLGYYSGLDYMLWYNLFLLAYQSDYSTWSQINNNSITTSFNNITGSNQPNGTTTGSIIVATNQLSSTSNVTDQGSISVFLNPGFVAPVGCNFQAISKGTDSKLIYEPNPLTPIPVPSNIVNTAYSESQSEAFVSSQRQNIIKESTNNKELQNQMEECNISISPNPCSGQFTCSINNNNIQSSTIEVINQLGKRVINEVRTGNTYVIDISSMSKGLYIVKVTVGDKLFINKLIYK